MKIVDDRNNNDKQTNSTRNSRPQHGRKDPKTDTHNLQAAREQESREIKRFFFNV